MITVALLAPIAIAAAWSANLTRAERETGQDVSPEMVGAQQMCRRWLQELLIEVILLRRILRRDRRHERHGEEHGQDHQPGNGASVPTKAVPHLMGTLHA